MYDCLKSWRFRMERKYYTINEGTAKLAKSMMSFNEYIEGSLSDKYKQMVDSTYNLADQTALKKPKETKREDCQYFL